MFRLRSIGFALSFVFTLAVSHSAMALSVPDFIYRFFNPDPAPTLERVATVAIGDLAVGRQWRWNYFDPKGAMYSTEQYTVVENVNGVVTLEMSTHFPNETIYRPHHRIQVRLEDCLRAYRDPFNKLAWSMRMFYLEDGKWNEVTPPTTLAFEEKFNCNPYKHDSREFLTEFKNSPVGELFIQRRWRTQDGSWFMNSGPFAGVSFEKEFPHGAGGGTYRCRFDSGNE